MNIELITNSELLNLNGEPGNFNARVQEYPRYIDLSKCTSCGECAKVCPVNLPNEYDKNLSDKQAAYKQYPQAIPGAYSIQKADKAPCRLACPAGLNVQGYVQMVKQGNYKRALEIIMENLPLPGVLGRICPHACEDACRRADLDEPISIRDLKRLAADQFDPREIEIKCEPERPERVAIVGSGPAGLSAAFHLARQGIKSTIYESLPKAGGMLRVGIPNHRLPEDILDQEIEIITNLGVTIKTSTPIGGDLTVEGLLEKEGFKAVYLAAGAHIGFGLGIPGERANGVRQGVDFLREVNLEGKAEVGKKVAIIGGGNVAIDVARASVRLGAEEVTIIYRRTRAEMPAWEEEILAAEHEDVKITYLTAPQEVITEDGQVTGLRCIEMELGEPDSSGRRRPVPKPGSEFDIEIDQLIPAIGQRPDISPLENIEGLAFTRWGTVEVDPVTYVTGREGVFAGGDLQTGPWVAIGAIAAGQEAAESILRYCDGRDMAEGREPTTVDDPMYRPVPEGISPQARAKVRELPADQRVGNFNEVELGFTPEIGMAEADRCINCGYCCECYQCVDACLAEAINHEMVPQSREIEIGSVVLCPGNEVFDPYVLNEFYHYKDNPNVVTSLEFERLLSASGPTMGHVVKLSDRETEPKKIAWLQCVGSRDTNKCGNSYCSSVCCMYALKEAMIAKEHAHNGLDCTIFNMDIRTFGKDYELYYDRAKNQGINFVRARIHTVYEQTESDQLLIKYADEAGEMQEEIFDMVVLSVGLQVPDSTLELAGRLGIEVNKDRFAKSEPFAPVETNRQGVYACGIFKGPKDIPTSVVDASAAACLAGAKLNESRNTQTKSVEVPEEIDVEGQDPRIGVFLCNCGVNIAGVVDEDDLEEYVKTLPNVTYVTQSLFTCSQDAQDSMKQIIKDEKLNRVVVAACTPKTHEPIFMDTLQATGLNKYLFEMANIRNQDSWCHADPAAATAKAKDLVRMAIARAGTLSPLHEKQIPVTSRGLVIGGGISGMNAALGLAEQGYEVVLLEKDAQLGGLGNRLTKTIEGAKIRPYVKELVGRVTDHPKIEVKTQAVVVNFSGFKGNFTTEVIVGDNMERQKIDHGVAIIATGAQEYKPKEFLYGEDDRVMTQLELGEALDADSEKIKKAEQMVMIQCVGSRNEEFPNCSRVCCQNAVKNALAVKKVNPDAQVFILYRDIRTYGLLEDYYTEARRQGVLFFRFTPDNPPVVEKNGDEIEVTFFDHVLRQNLTVSTDVLALSAGVRPAETQELATIMKLARSSEGFFNEAHVKLRPVDMGTEGVFLCGTAHAPKLISESIPQAQAAASRAVTFLSQPHLTLSAVTAYVDQPKCASCLVCVRSCPYGVPRINEEGVSEIDPALCQGCGVCAAECPAKAIELNWYEDEQLMCKIDSLLEGVL